MFIATYSRYVFSMYFQETIFLYIWDIYAFYIHTYILNIKRKESWSWRIDTIFRSSKIWRNIENSLKESLKCKVLFIRTEELFFCLFLQVKEEESLYTDKFFAYQCTRNSSFFSLKIDRYNRSLRREQWSCLFAIVRAFPIQVEREGTLICSGLFVSKFRVDSLQNVNWYIVKFNKKFKSHLKFFLNFYTV